MNGIYLKFFAYELQQHQGKLIYEWLLEFAKKQGIRGGSVFRGIAGFGRHGQIHEEHFFELASDVPVEIVFIVSEEQSRQLIDLLKQENIDLLFVKMPAEYGNLNNGTTLK